MLVTYIVDTMPKPQNCKIIESHKNIFHILLYYLIIYFFNVYKIIHCVLCHTLES